MFISCRSLKFFIYISKSHMHSFFLFTSLFIHKWFFTFERSKVTKIFCKAEGISLYLSLTATSMSPSLYSCFRQTSISKKIVLSLHPTRFYNSPSPNLSHRKRLMKEVTSQPFLRHQYAQPSLDLYHHDLKQLQ